MQLALKHRPSSWAEVVGQDKAVEKLRALARSGRGLGGRAYWITGASGTGKGKPARSSTEGDNV